MTTDRLRGTGEAGEGVIGDMEGEVWHDFDWTPPDDPNTVTLHTFTDEQLAVYVAAERDRAVAEALAPVRALHTPDPSGDWCDHCWTGPDSHGNGPSPEWPCATIRALRAALPDEPTGEGT